ncbi:MAG: hypothetical protein WC593_15720 [Methanoregula sp.]
MGAASQIATRECHMKEDCKAQLATAQAHIADLESILKSFEEHHIAQTQDLQDQITELEAQTESMWPIISKVAQGRCCQGGETDSSGAVVFQSIKNQAMKIINDYPPSPTQERLTNAQAEIARLREENQSMRAEILRLLDGVDEEIEQENTRLREELDKKIIIDKRINWSLSLHSEIEKLTEENERLRERLAEAENILQQVPRYPGGSELYKAIQEYFLEEARP